MRVKVAYFDATEMTVVAPITEPGARAALNAFLALTPADRIADSRHVYAYYRDYHEAVGGEDWMDEEMGVPASPEDIWLYVTPVGEIDVSRDHDGPDWYVAIEANCGWEQEHGLMMVWRGGKVLSKVGGYDGHVSNASAYDDDSLANVVYAASNPAYTTRLDPAE